MPRILVVALLGWTLALTGCATTSATSAPTTIATSEEPSPYKSYKWIKEETWWERQASPPSTRTVAIGAAEAAEVLLWMTVPLAFVLCIFVAHSPINFSCSPTTSPCSLP